MIDPTEITKDDIEEISTLAANCFINDPFYLTLSDKEEERFSLIKNMFKKSIDICINHGMAFGNKNDTTFSSFILLFNYAELKKYHPEDYCFIFNGNEYTTRINTNLKAEVCFIEEMLNGSEEYFYLLAMGVKEEYRRKGYAINLVKAIISAYPHYNIFADVSNNDSIKLYENLGFEIFHKENKLTFILYHSGQDNIVINHNESDTLKLLIPIRLDTNLMGLRVVTETIVNINYIKTCEDEIPFFVSSPVSNSQAKVICISYEDLLIYQRYINVTFFNELKIPIDGEYALLYTSNILKFNGLSNYSHKIDPYDKKEWNLIPDLYTSIPVKYNDRNKLLTKNKESFLANRILKALDFRTTYESGVPVRLLDEKRFKYRIERFYLGSIKLQILEETTIAFNGRKTDEKPYGSPISVELFISIDNQTNCAVLHLASFSFGLLITHYLDSVSRNQINVIHNEENINLYNYLEANFGIEKKGSAKTFLSMPYNRDSLDQDLLASILFCETLYEEGVNIGRITDKDIINIVSDKQGNAQYGYATVYAYKNILVQISASFRESLYERLITESITLFYIELVLFEEAAIEIANDQIIHFLADIDRHPPRKVLKIINNIMSEHVKSIEFWNIQMNYPSSKKSIDDVIRKSFDLDNLRASIKRNQKELLMIYDIRSDIVDKSETILISVIGVIFTAISFVNLLSNASDIIMMFLTLIIILIVLIVYRKYLNRSVLNKKKR